VINHHKSLRPSEPCRIDPPCCNFFVHSLRRALQPVLGWWWRVLRRAKSRPYGGQHSWSSRKLTIFCSQAKASTGAFLLDLGFCTFAITYFTQLYVHLSIGVQWNPRLHYDPSCLSCLLDESKSHYSMALLSNSRLRLKSSGRKPLVIGSLLSMVVLWLVYGEKVDKWS
jgi:hypothetical protein